MSSTFPPKDDYLHIFCSVLMNKPPRNLNHKLNSKLHNRLAQDSGLGSARQLPPGRFWQFPAGPTATGGHRGLFGFFGFVRRVLFTVYCVDMFRCFIGRYLEDFKNGDPWRSMKIYNPENSQNIQETMCQIPFQSALPFQKIPKSTSEFVQELLTELPAGEHCSQQWCVLGRLIRLELSHRCHQTVYWRSQSRWSGTAIVQGIVCCFWLTRWLSETITRVVCWQFKVYI